MPLIKDLVNKQPIPAELKTKQKDYLPVGILPIIDQGQQLIGGYSDDTSKVLSCNLPAIVFGDHTRAVKYLDMPFGAGADGIKVLLPKTNVCPKYLYYGLQYIVSKMPDRGYSRQYQYVEKENLSLPEYDKQERIVAHIEELFSQLDSGVETLKKTRQQLEVYRQAVYNSAFQGVEVAKPFSDFFEVSGGVTKNSKRCEYQLKMPYLRVANVYYNQIDLSEIKEIGIKENELEKCILQINDILFVEGNGSKSQIGRVAIWRGELSECVHQNHIIKGRPRGNMLSDYALYYFMSSEGRKQIIDVAKSTSGLYTLSTNKIKELTVPYCELEKQRIIVSEIEERLSEYEQLEKMVEKAIQQAVAIRQSILKQAFEGRI